MNGLIRLHLSGNKIRKFYVKSGCLQNLILLDLSENEFSTISTHLWETLSSLTTVDISSNPLNCDCDIMPAVKELSRSPTSSLNQVNLFANWFYGVNSRSASFIYYQNSPLYFINYFIDKQLCFLLGFGKSFLDSFDHCIHLSITNNIFLVSESDWIYPFPGLCYLCCTGIAQRSKYLRDFWFCMQKQPSICILGFVCCTTLCSYDFFSHLSQSY